ncbi:MAG: YhfC family intramembrane metalloprotease [Thaumarchaeota archaeon]|nr:YhfC family intramembrane metalloprotease [Nitrososphaerota archaeon]
MQNIDPVLLVQPVIFIAISAGLIVYWRLRRRFAAIVLLFSFVAYAGAIALKELVQVYTYGDVTAVFGSVSWQTGLYLGAQTSVFEVGLAYLVARYAVSGRAMEGADGEAYGISLAFWENGILLGALALVNLATTYLLIADGLMPASVYQTLASSNPSLFDAPRQLAIPLALGVLERVSSLLSHFAWGYLCVLAAYMHRRVYFLIALPMGLLDALVPFAREFPLWEFEGLLFLISLGSFLVAWKVTEKDRRSGYGRGPPKN